MADRHTWDATSVPALSCRHTEAMAISSQDFLAELLSKVPEAKLLVDEHLGFYEELLLHILVADLLRMAIAMFEQGQSESLDRLLLVLDHALTEGDDFVKNAIAVSFVEDTPSWDPDKAAFMSMWPAELADEADRQRRWWAKHSAP